MHINHKTNSLLQVDSHFINLEELVQTIEQSANDSFEYMGVNADDLSGVLGTFKLAYFELAHLARLKLMPPGTIIRILERQKALRKRLRVRGQRGKIVFDSGDKSFIMNRQNGRIRTEPRRYLANRVAECEYKFLPGSKGITFGGTYFHTADQVDMVATNEFGFAVAGGNTIEIFENGQSYTHTAQAKSICWGTEGLLFVNNFDELWIVKEFRFSARRYEARSLTNYYTQPVTEDMELVCCGNKSVVVFRSGAASLKINVIQGQSLTCSLDPRIVGRVLHFGAFYWREMLTVYFILGDPDGVVNEYYEKRFNVV